LGAMPNTPPAFAEMRRRNPVVRASPRIALARAAATKRTVQIADVQTEPGYFDPLPGFSTSQIGMLAGARTVVAVPMLKESELMGVIAIYRQEVSPFTDKQIGLVRIAPARRSSPSRTRGCSTSCGNLCNSRPPPPTCLRS